MYPPAQDGHISCSISSIGISIISIFVISGISMSASIILMLVLVVQECDVVRV